MTGSRRAMVAALVVAALAGGCAQPPRPAPTVQSPAAGQVAGGYRLVHDYRFPDGERLAPPTGRPRLGWQQAYLVSQRDFGTRELDGLRITLARGMFVNPRAPVHVTLADYRRRGGSAGPRLAWVVVYRNDQALRFGPTPVELREGRDRLLMAQCPVYAVVDASSGRYLEEFSACRPPYRG